MKIAFLHSDKPRERLLADAFIDGLGKDEGFKWDLQKGIPDCDVACMVGVKSKDIFTECLSRDVRIIMFDKGYVRHSSDGPIKCWEYWRVSVNHHHPTIYLDKAKHKSDRFEQLKLNIKPWKTNGKHILIAGSSAKYHRFYKLREPTVYTQKLIKDIRLYTNRRIVYRPKPTWREAVPIEGVRYSGPSNHLSKALGNAAVLVTHGSNTCFEAVVNGVPCIILGEGVARPISSARLEDIDDPYLATEEERLQWLYNIAYCQWTFPEFASGEAWEHLRPQIYG